MTYTPVGESGGDRSGGHLQEADVHGRVDDKQALTTVRFEVMDEGGKPVADDVFTEGDPGQPANSLKNTMVQISKGQ